MTKIETSPRAERFTLVTGGAGFIGSHVAEALISSGYPVVVLDDLSGGTVENVPPEALFVKGSIQDRSLISKLFEKYRFQYIFHIAAYAAEILSHHIKHFNYQNNLIGSINLINAAVNWNVKCFVFTSSIGVYGQAKPPTEENTLPNPADSYGIAKYAVELELRSSQDMFGLDYIIFRPHNVYGERQNISDPYRNVIGIFMNQVMQNQLMTVYGDGNQKRAFSHILDVAPTIARSIEVTAAYNQIFNIGGDSPYTINHLVDVIAETMKVNKKVEYLPSRHESYHAYSSHEKLDHVFGKQESISLEEGVKKMADWVLNSEYKPSPVFTDIEIRKNMPPSWEVLSGHHGR